MSIQTLAEFWDAAERIDPQGFARSRAEQTELETLRKDAARYAFLRSDFSPMGLDANANHSWAYRRNFTLRGPNLDAAIDAAMAAEAKEKQSR